MKRTRPVPPWKQGSIKNENITMMEQIEYRQTGMIKIKDVPLSDGELKRRRFHDVSYYDFVERDNLRRLLDDLDYFNS